MSVQACYNMDMGESQSHEPEPLIGPARFARMIGVSIKTLQRWDRKGILVAGRTPTDRRFYTMDQYRAYMVSKTDKPLAEEDRESEDGKREVVAA